jgi:ActR/RegA family two-component response regulator
MTDVRLLYQTGHRCIRSAVKYSQPGAPQGYCIMPAEADIVVEVFADMDNPANSRIYGTLTPEMEHALAEELWQRIERKTAQWYSNRTV